MRTERLPPLYKLDSTGKKMIIWKIEIQEKFADNPADPTVGALVVQYGQMDGKITTSIEYVSKGKNVGRRNETAPYEQAVLEGKSKWKRKLDEGYVTSPDRARSGETNATGGISPMLAHTFADFGARMIFPCAAQPKLDGIRCVAVISEFDATLWSRQRNQITSLPHIAKELFDLFGGVAKAQGSIIFDGELYNHEVKNFPQIQSKVMRKQVLEDADVIQYHVYDLVDGTLGFDMRLKDLVGLFKRHGEWAEYTRIVETMLAKSAEHLFEIFDYYTAQGYEGAMARRLDTPYEYKRSYSLLKVKDFLDDDFEIINVLEGRGKLAGHAGTFVCTTKQGQLFNAKLEGPFAYLKKCLEEPAEWENKYLTVRYQELLPSGIPRFPVGVKIVDRPA